MVYLKGNIVFLKSIDASDSIKGNKYIYGFLNDVIKEVDKENMVLVQDRGLTFVKVGKLLINKYNLY